MMLILFLGIRGFQQFLEFFQIHILPKKEGKSQSEHSQSLRFTMIKLWRVQKVHGKMELKYKFILLQKFLKFMHSSFIICIFHEHFEDPHTLNTTFSPQLVSPAQKNTEYILAQSVVLCSSSESCDESHKQKCLLKIEADKYTRNVQQLIYHCSIKCDPWLVAPRNVSRYSLTMSCQVQKLQFKQVLLLHNFSVFNIIVQSGNL